MRPKTTSSTPAPVPEKIQEVEFALVLSNIIESLKNDPAQLRSTVYELARIKLQDQIVDLDETDAERLTQSLEVAIRGVEDFSIRRDNPTLLHSFPPALLPSRSPRNTTDEATFTVSAERQPSGNAPALVGSLLTSEKSPGAVGAQLRTPIRSRRLSFAPGFFLAATIVLAIAAIIYRQADSIKQPPLGSTTEANDPRKGEGIVSQLVPAPPSEAVVPPEAPVLTRSAGPLPTTFGVYAVSANRLFELEMLPIRAPDRRIAMSAAINIPSRTTLPDGKVRFIVFRRDSSLNAVERPEVRVIAKVARAVTFEDGKANVSDKDDSWIMRNISRELKAAPVKDNPEMYEIMDGVDEAPLSAGRYALVLKGQAYEFTVEGTVTDLNQCIERTVAANGSFFSECRKR